MKILHCADLHLGSPLTARLSGEKLAMRRAELTASFFTLVRVAKEAGATAFLLSGDIFDSSATAVVHIADFLSEIEKNPQIGFYYIPGNHEKDLLKGRDLPTNLYTFGEEWHYYSLPGVTIAGRDLPEDGMFSSLNLPRGTMNFVLLHGAVTEGYTGEIPLAAAAGKNIDYLALGHYHAFTELTIDTRGVAVYPGSPEGRGFDETGAHGCVLIDTDGARPTFRFIRTAKRLYLAPEIALDGAESSAEIERRADAALADISRASAVRLTFTGTNPGLPLPTASLTYRYGKEFFLFEIKDKSAPDLRRAALESPLARAFIASCEEDATLSEEERRTVLTMGLSALAGEELPSDI
mgnify:CR=1 FL=1